MRSLLFISCLSALGLLAGQRPAQAQGSEPAQGFSIWLRGPRGSAQDLVGSASGVPQFAIGVRRERLTLGVGLGISRVSASDEDSFGGQVDEDEFTATLFQVGPEALFEVWRSTDARTRGNIAGGLSVGRLSATEENTFTDVGGQRQTDKTKTTGTLLSVRLGLGGDHFLHPHFALGLEAGIQGTFALGVETEGGAGKFGFGASGTYAALRAQIVF